MENPWVTLNFDLSGENYQKAYEIIKDFKETGAESNYIVGGIFCLYDKNWNQNILDNIYIVIKKYKLKAMGKDEMTLMQELSIKRN